MSQGLLLLDEALELARQEKRELENGEYDGAIETAKRRAEITEMAWNYLPQADKEPYRQKLLALAEIQQELTATATEAHDLIRNELNRSRLEKKRMKGYHIAVGQAMQ